MWGSAHQPQVKVAIIEAILPDRQTDKGKDGFKEEAFISAGL